MNEKISLKESARALGIDLAYELSPILVAKNGEIIDGEHRKREDRKWKKRTIQKADTAVKIAASRLVVNHNRRIADENDFDQLAKALQKEELGKQSYLVESGLTIAKRIVQLTSINERIVYENLNQTFKGPSQSGGDVTSPLGQSEVFRVPKALAPEVREFIKQSKKAVEATPDTDKTNKIQDVKNKLQNANDALKHEMLKEKALSKIKVESMAAIEPPAIENEDRAELRGLLHGKDDPKQNDGSLQIAGLGEQITVTHIIKPILRVLGSAGFKCPSCKQSYPLNPEGLSFGISKDNLKDLGEALTEAQTLLTELASKPIAESNPP